jgi:S-adenosylmethionine:tRNA ribosyltransferase-isomerase
LIPHIHIADYCYDLPEERIARFPLERRDAARLLTCISGAIDHTRFTELPALLPENTLLVFNETKVIPARLLFRKATGAVIELFCMDPVRPGNYEQCFAATSTCEWKCVAGNLKRWKGDRLALPCGEGTLQAELLERQEGYVIVRFTWDGHRSFAQVLDQCGAVPIPPYLKRAAVAADTDRYQTVYARYRGSVAAPTAGLHFTPELLSAIAARGIASETVTLHVGAGTFRPVKSDTLAGHVMHCEPFTVTRQALQHISAHLGHIVAVGTTSARTLESLYWLGQQCLHGAPTGTVTQWEPYLTTAKATPREALGALLAYMEQESLETLHAATQLLIAPSYPFQVVRGLITNFHQPQSTLLLLISALIGPQWQAVYRYALAHDFRFLSYGDSSLLLPA